MTRSSLKHGAKVMAFLGVFGAGFLCGTLSQPCADAQLGELGKEAMKQAGGGAGTLGSAMELGNAIVDMQQHVDGLQKNIDALKKIKAALGG